MWDNTQKAHTFIAQGRNLHPAIAPLHMNIGGKKGKKMLSNTHTYETNQELLQELWEIPYSTWEEEH